MKIKQINPNSRPKINIYEEVQESFHFVWLKKYKDRNCLAKIHFYLIQSEKFIKGSGSSDSPACSSCPANKGESI